MGKITMKNLSLVAGLMVLAATAGQAQAETRFAVQDSAAVDKMVITDTGAIGIGTTTPTSQIQVKGSTMSAATMDLNYGGNATYNKFMAPTLQFTRNNLPGDNLGKPKFSDRLGFINFGSVIGGTFRQGAQMNAIAESGSWSATSFPAAFTFSTADAVSLYAIERLRIASTGNVGIGVSTPAQKLEVNGGILLNTVTTKPTCTSAIRGTLWFTRATTDVLEVCAQTSGATPVWRTVSGL